MSRPSRRELDQIRPAFLSAKDRGHPAVAIAGVGLGEVRELGPQHLFFVWDTGGAQRWVQ